MIREKIPTESHEPTVENSNVQSETHFYEFLKTYKPAGDKPVIFFFDEIEKAYSVNSFLHLWRRVYHERDDENNLANYRVIAAGKAELSSLTAGEDADSSPFNIARTLNLGEIKPGECQRLINEPLTSLGFQVKPGAVQALIEETRGHPQLLQHLCFILADSRNEPGTSAPLTGDDVDNAIDILFLESMNLKTLLKDIETGKIPGELILKILKGEKIRFLPYQSLSFTGTGPVVNEGRYCALRNPVYREYLEQVRELIPGDTKETGIPLNQEHSIPQQLAGQLNNTNHPGQADTYRTTIYFTPPPQEYTSLEEEKHYLQEFFKKKSLEVKIEKNGHAKEKRKLSGGAKHIFGYLAYKNYKAINWEGYRDWESIPDSYNYRLSSQIKNNDAQEPEWQVFFEYLESIGKKPVDQDIRQWKHALLKILEGMNIGDILDSTPGRGTGYLLKGTVEFSV